MKPHYSLSVHYWWWCDRYDRRYRLVVGHYYRHPKTTNELRQLKGAENDREPPVRRRRLGIPTFYDDPMVARNYGKSWKDYTKRRKQWDR